MKIYIVKQYEAIEGGGKFESIEGVWFDKARAEEQAESCNAGRYISQDVTVCDVNDPENVPDVQAEVRSDALLADCIIAFNILQDAPEINPSNYDHDDVCLLNAAACEAYQILNDAIKTANNKL